MVGAQSRRRVSVVIDVAVALLAPALALAVSELLHSMLGLTRLGVLFLAAVIAAAIFRGSRAAIPSAIVSLIFYKLFLDLRAGEVTGPVEDIMNLAIFLLVAIVTGTLAGRAHDQAAAARRHADRMELLVEASQSFAKDERQTFWPTLARTLSRLSGGPAVVVDRRGAVQGTYGDHHGRDDDVQHVASAVLEEDDPAIRDMGAWSARMIRSEDRAQGVMLWKAQERDPATSRVIDLLAELTAASMTAFDARGKQMRMQAAEESAKLREALLSSISHDFRSPLAAIIGSSSSLLEYGERFDDEVRRDLLENIRDEGERLNQFVGNLLSHTRLQAGVVKASREATDVSAVIASALARLELHRGPMPVTCDCDCTAEADPLLLEQALYNIFDNAWKYADRARGLEVHCTSAGRHCRILVADRGPGLPSEDLPQLFTSFHFARKGTPTGTGLGLSITRGFVEAMGGKVEARGRTDGRCGLQVIIDLPKGATCRA